MATIIKPKRSGTGGAAPTTSNLADGEIAVNSADQKIYIRSSSSIVTLGVGSTSTAAELNIMDGDTSAVSTTVADADRVVYNDAGTMKQVAVTDLAAYFDDEITAMPNLVTTAATTVGALNSGSITSGFGTIDTGSSAITTTGLISGGSLDIDHVLINGTTIGHTDDPDLMTVADGVLTVAGRIDATNDIKTDNIRRYTDSSTTTKIRLQDEVMKFNVGHASNETLKLENNAITATGTLTVGVDDTGYDVKFFGATASAYMLWDENVDDLILAGVAGLIVPDGQFTLGSTAVTSTAAELNLLDGVSGLVQADLTKLAAVDATAAEINLIDGGTARGTTAVVSGDGILINDGGTMQMTNVDTVSTYFASHSVGGGNIVTTGALNSGSITSGFGTIDTGSSNITTTGTVSAGNLTVTGTTTTVNSTVMTVVDPIINLQTASGGGAIGSDTNKDVGLAMHYHTGSAAKIAFLGYDDSAGKLTFVTDATLSSEVVSGTAGTIVADLEGTVQTAAQGSITSLGTLTTLTVDNVIINGSTIGHTGDDDLMTVASGILTVAGEVSMTTLDIGGTNVTSTAAELNILDGVTKTAAQINASATTGKSIAMAIVFGGG